MEFEKVIMAWIAKIMSNKFLDTARIFGAVKPLKIISL